METSQVTKDQHYVPKFYLKRFADSKGMLQALDLMNRRVAKPKPYSGVCYEKFFYGTDSGVADSVSQNFEDMFAHLENKMAESWDEIIERALHAQLLLEDFDTLSWFLSMQMIRTKGIRMQMQHMLHDARKKIIAKHIDLTEKYPAARKKLEVTIGKNLTSEDLQETKKFVEQEEFALSSDNLTHLNFIRRNLETFRNLILFQQWNVVFANDYKFITTDNPVLQWAPKPKGFFGPSFIERSQYLALSPEILLEFKPNLPGGEISLDSIDEPLIAAPHELVLYKETSDDEVLMYDMLLSSYGNNFAYARSRDEFEEILRQIQNPGIAVRLYADNFLNN